LQLGENVLGRQKNLRVLLNHPREEHKVTVLRLQEIEQRVPRLLAHEVGAEGAAVARHKLRGELDDVDVERLEGGRVRDELEVGGRLLRHEDLLD